MLTFLPLCNKKDELTFDFSFISSMYNVFVLRELIQKAAHLSFMTKGPFSLLCFFLYIYKRPLKII